MPVSIGAPVHSITPYAKPPPTAGAMHAHAHVQHGAAGVASSHKVSSFFVVCSPLGCGFIPPGLCLDGCSRCGVWFHFTWLEQVVTQVE